MYKWKVKYLDNPEDNRFMTTTVIAKNVREAIDMVENEGHMVVGKPKIVGMADKHKILSTAETGIF
jgi:hypothetical protein